jgi:periplasmic divalent cation tolerance protein
MENSQVRKGGDAIVVLVTTATREEGETIARRLVENRLVACVNVVPQIRSVFRWEGALSQEDEALLVIKSKRDRLPALVAAVKKLHSYTVPEIIALPIVEGSEDYLRWIDEATT